MTDTALITATTAASGSLLGASASIVAATRVDELDPLRAFAHACRIELLAGQVPP